MGDDSGIGEELKGSAKKAAGQVSGNEDLEREGEAQREKQDAERKAEEKEMEAAEARDDADGLEAEQRKSQ